MKKLLLIVLVFSLFCSLAACGETVSPEQASFLEDVKDIAMIAANDSSDVIQIVTYEIQFASDYRLEHGSDPSAKELREAAESWYKGKGGNWASLRKNYEHIIVTYEAFKETNAFKAPENAEISRCLREIYKNYFTLFQYATNGQGSSSDAVDSAGKILDALKAIEPYIE